MQIFHLVIPVDMMYGSALRTELFVHIYDTIPGMSLQGIN